MRVAYTAKDWLLSSDGALQGLNLGFDHCGEHGWGVKPLMQSLGIDLPEFPVGVDDHRIREVPKMLTFLEYEARSKDKRFKPYPAALLTFSTDCLSLPAGRTRTQAVALVSETHTEFWPDHPQKRSASTRDDLMTSWDRNGFAIHVRGEENIERLRELHAAFQRRDIALAMPWAHAFLRGGLSFAILSALSDEDKAAVSSKFADAKALALAARATGIEARLTAAGMRVDSIRPDWADERKQGVVFFVSPHYSQRARFGWYTVEDLDAWIAGAGPVRAHPDLTTFEAQPALRDWAIRLLRGLNDKGIQQRFHSQLVWKDEAARVPGVNLRVHYHSEHLLPSGVYDFEELMGRYAAPLEPAVPLQRLADAAY
jgi:hypothetical protein